MNPGQITFRSLWSAALTMAASLPLAAQEAPPDPFLAVTGIAEARIPTDLARIEFMVETQAATAREATAQNADRMQRVIRAVRKAGRETVTVETGGYNLSPVYSRASRDQPDIPTIEAYRAANYVRVWANELARVGALIDAAIGAGSNRIASLRFEARDPEPARLEALRGAVAKAQVEAGRGSARCDAGDAPGGQHRCGLRLSTPGDAPGHSDGHGSGRSHPGRAGRAGRARDRHHPLPPPRAVTAR